MGGGGKEIIVSIYMCANVCVCIHVPICMFWLCTCDSIHYVMLVGGGMSTKWECGRGGVHNDHESPLGII